MNPESNGPNPAEIPPKPSAEQIAEMLREATRLRAQRIDTDIKKREELIAHAKELDGKLKELDRTIGQFESDFARDNYLDQAQVDLLEQLKQGREATRQALADTESQTDTISGKPEVMVKVQEEAEETQEKKEQFNETIKKIDQIKDLLDKAQQLYDEAKKIAAAIQIKNDESSVILNNAKQKASSLELRRALNFGIRPDMAEKLAEIRNSLGIFKGRDKAIIDQIQEKVMPILRESESLHASYRSSWNEAGELRQQAELLRKTAMLVYYRSDPGEKKKFKDIYMTKIGRECRQEIL